MLFEIIGITINPGLEIFYITDNMNYQQSISRLLLSSEVIQYPPYPDVLLLNISIDCIGGDTLIIYNKTNIINTDIANINNSINWNDGNNRLIFIQNEKSVTISNDITYNNFLNNIVSLFELQQESSSISSIYMDLINNKIWFIDNMIIRYFDITSTKIYDYFKCPYPSWFTLNECLYIFPTNCKFDTCSLIIDENTNIMYIASGTETNSIKTFYFDLNTYLLNPHILPIEFLWDINIGYKSGEFRIYNNHLYFAVSDIGILRKPLNKIGIDGTFEIFIDKIGFGLASINCFVNDIIRNIMYICVNNRIYYFTFDPINNIPSYPSITINSVTTKQLNISLDILPSSAILHSIDINTNGTMLFFQFRINDNLYMSNYPTSFGCKYGEISCNPISKLLLSDSSLYGSFNVFYYASTNKTVLPSINETNITDITDSTDNNYTYYYYVDIKPNKYTLTKWLQKIYSMESNHDEDFYIYYKIIGNNHYCLSPTLSFEYERILYIEINQYLDIFDDKDTLINNYYECLSNKEINYGNDLLNGSIYKIHLYKSQQVGINNNLCFNPIQSIQEIYRI